MAGWDRTLLSDEEDWEVGQLFGGYFNQDWDLDYASWEEAVDAFSEGHGPEAARAAAFGIGKLLAAGLDDAALERAITWDFGSSYYPPGEGMTMRVWLGRVRDQLTSR